MNTYSPFSFMRWLGHGRRRAMTLIEVAIAGTCTLIMVTGAIGAIVVGVKATHRSAMHSAAMCLCQQRFEQIRATQPFSSINATTFPNETGIVLTHTESNSLVNVLCSRTAAINDISATGLPAKRVLVTVTWTWSNRTEFETLEGIFYDFTSGY